MTGASPPAVLARKSLEYYLRTGKKMPVPKELPEMLQVRAGAFVSLKKQGQLRGCIGTFGPTQPTVAEEIINNAVSAGVEDPRFWPVEPEELPDIEISVDILSEPEQIFSEKDLDPKRYGIIVKKGRRTGLLLPDLEGVDTIDEQISIAMQKAGISADEEIEIYRFEVKRFK